MLTETSDAYCAIQDKTMRKGYQFSKRLPKLRPNQSFDVFRYTQLNNLYSKHCGKLENPAAHLNTFRDLNAIDLIVYQFSYLIPIGHLQTCFAFHDGAWSDPYFHRFHDIVHKVREGCVNSKTSTFSQYFYLHVTLQMLSKLGNYSPKEQAYLILYLFNNHEEPDCNILSIDEDFKVDFDEYFYLGFEDSLLLQLQDLLKSLNISFTSSLRNQYFPGEYPLEELEKSIKDIFLEERNKAVIHFFLSCIEDVEESKPVLELSDKDNKDTA